MAALGYRRPKAGEISFKLRHARLVARQPQFGVSRRKAHPQLVERCAVAPKLARDGVAEPRHSLIDALLRRSHEKPWITQRLLGATKAQPVACESVRHRPAKA